VETVNDVSGFVTNVWRAIRADPDTVADLCDDWINEVDLMARHLWLVNRAQTLTDALIADPDYYDAKAAAWWVWGASSWIGSGWCNGDGPWVVEDGRVVKRSGGRGATRQMPIISAAGGYLEGKPSTQGVHSVRAGVTRKMPAMPVGPSGYAVASGVHSTARGALRPYFARLAARLRNVRVVCGQWDRILSPRITTAFGTCGVLLDPPYPGTDNSFYDAGDTDTWHAAQAWAIAHGDNPQYRIALCGLDNQEMPPTWKRVAWKRAGGYGSQGDGVGRANASREVVWYSPHCGALDDLPMWRGI
jgi:hypothetical protein